ncbi:ELWxxDGT repeat protein, partial [Cyanobium sp. N5-Cardenillas]|uniref:ELWxxDGT repeat protein n=1 Tax=Cyanobium sp. N5-Cardenillas TaxID=2823720 RepID=UPI0020CBA425
ENGATNLIYTFTRTGATTSPLTVNYAINGTATGGSDYAAIPASVIFSAGSASTTVTVDPTGDTVLEPNETVSLTLTADPAYLIGTAGAVTGTITNDDAASFSIGDVSITEGNAGTSTAVFTVTLSNAVSGGTSVAYATANGTATAGSDYTVTSGTLNFTGNAGETKTVSVTITGDTVFEPDETFFLNLSAPTNGVTLADSQGIGTITNEDAAPLPVISLAVSPASVTENGVTNLVYTFTRTGATTSPLTVNYAINGTATGGNDYGAIPTSVVFAAGSATATVTVDPNADAILEPDESVSVTLTADPAYVIGTTTAVTGTITNDDAASFSISDVTLTEGIGGTTTAVFTVTLSNAVGGGASVSYATADNTATAGSDYLATAGTLNFTGTAGEQRTVSVTINGDTEVEPNESFFLNLSAPTNGVTIADGQGRGTISNDDIPPQPAGTPVLFFSAVTAASGRELWLTDGTEAGTRQVIDATPGPSGAFPSTVQLANGKLLFASDDAAGDTELWVTDGTTAGTSQLVEINPIVSFSSAIAPTFITPFDGGALFFADDGLSGNELWFTDGTAAGTRLLADIQPGATGSRNPVSPFRQLTVSGSKVFFTANTTAEGNELWVIESVAAGPQLVTEIVAGSGSGGISVLTPFNDGVFFYANDGINGVEAWFSDGTAAGTVSLGNLSPLATAGATNPTVVDDRIFFAVQVSNTPGVLGGELYVSDGTAASTTRVLANVQWPINTVGAVDGKAVFIANDGVSGSELWISDGTPSGTKILKDIQPGGINSNGALGAGAGILFNGELYFRGTTTAEGAELWKTDGTEAGTVLVADINPGTGSSNVDFLFSTILNGRLYFRATTPGEGLELWSTDGTTSGTSRVADINPGTAGSTPTNFSVQVLPPPVVSISLAPATAEEGEAFTLTATRSGAVLSQPTTVTYTITGPAANAGDIATPLTGTITILANQTTATLSIGTVEDTVVEADEPFTVTITNPVNGSIGTATATATILNDDAAALPVITLAISPASVLENGAGNLVYTFTRTGATTNPLTVNYTIGGTATNGSDYGLIPTSGPSLTDISFVSNGSSFINDTVVGNGTSPLAFTTTTSLSEPFLNAANSSISLGLGSYYAIAFTGFGEHVGNGQVSLREDGGSLVTQNVVFPSPTSASGEFASFVLASGNTVAISATGLTADRIRITSDGGGLTSGGAVDAFYAFTYAAPSNGTIPASVVFAAGSATATVTVDPTGDAVLEPDETVSLTLSPDPAYIVGTPGAVIGTISNDDAAPLPVITLAVSPASVTENGTSNLVYTFTRTGATTNPLTVNYMVGGSATNGSDYGLIGSSVIFAAGSATATVTVDPTGDAVLEPDETVSLTLSADPAYLIGTPDAITGTISNDDAASFSISDVSIVEGDSGTSLAVFTVTLSNAVAGGASVAYATANGTASAGSDYVSTAGSLNFAGTAGETQTVSVTINGDTDVEPNESFFLNLSAPTNGVTLADGQGLGTISNDDVGNSDPVFVADPAISIRPGQTATITGANLVANDTDPDGDTLSVAQFSIATSQGGSVANTAFDTYTYTPPANFTGTDTFSYVITDGFGGTANATLAINVGARPSITLAVSPASVLENGASDLVYTFTRTGPTTDALTVNYSIGGTATNGSDYDLIDTSVSFATGSATASVSVNPIGDSVVEPDETVALTLQADAAYTIGTAGAVIGTITNDDLGRTITGTKNRDALEGTAGDDVIIGLQGPDTVRGNGGADRFVYTSIVDAGDTIIDFNGAEGDKVDLKGALASVGYTGTTPITDGYLTFAAKGSDTMLLLDPDGSGLAAARSFILFKNVTVASLSNPDNFMV